MMTTDSRPTVLVIDDTPENIDILSDTLRPFYTVKAALSGERALAIAAAIPRPDMILLDIMMSGMDGLEVCRRLKADPGTASIPVIFVTALGLGPHEEMGLSLGAVDYLTKPISPPIVLARVKTHLALSLQNQDLEEKVRLRTEELSHSQLEIIRRLGRAAEYRDNETGLHVIRMSHYAYLIAQHYGIAESWCQCLLNSAPMHDVGKIGIPDAILLKPGPLSAEEWHIMKQHPTIGADIIGGDGSDMMRMSGEIAIGHHEKWDGTGYPHSKKGREIPLSARIVAIADVFDALTTARPYKSAWPIEEALSYMRAQSGKHFEPALLDIFLRIMPEILQIKDRYREQGLPYRQERSATAVQAPVPGP
jgi:putative two-component system response regulator